MVLAMRVSLVHRSSLIAALGLAFALLAPESSAQPTSTHARTAAALPRGPGARGGFTTALTGPSCTSDWISTFDGGAAPNGSVFALLAFDDGTGPALYVGGAFTSAGGMTVNHIARWNGSAWSSLGTGLDGNCFALAVYDDGAGPALYAAGDFANASGQPAQGVAKWKSNAWQALSTGLSGSLAGSVAGYALLAYDDGGGPALYCAGDFTSAGGASANGIARWNGASWSALGQGLNEPAYALAAFNDGSGDVLYAGGAFTQAGGSPANRIATWNAGTWSAVGSGVSGGLGSPAVDALMPYSIGGVPYLYVGGAFTSAGGISGAWGIARFDGTQWQYAGHAEIFVDPEDILPGEVDAFALLDDGTGPALYAGGSWTGLSGASNSIGKTTDGNWQSLGTHPNATVYALSGFNVGSGAKLYVGGTIPIRVWDGVALAWSTISYGVTAARALTVFHAPSSSGPALVLAGGVVPVHDASVAQVASWNGASWTALTHGVTTAAGVWTLVSFDDGSGNALYAGGSFTTIDGVSANHIAKWNGSMWSPMGSGIDGSVNVLRVLDDGTGPALYAGGSFTLAGGTSASCIAKWSGSAWTALGAGTTNTVWDVAIFDEGSGPRIFAAGEFPEADGNYVGYVARWNGSAWSPMGGGLNSFGRSLAVHDDGSGPALYVGGQFTTAGSPVVQAKGVARWNGIAWTALAAGLNGTVESLDVFDHELYAGGTFTNSGGSHSFIKRWNGASWTQLGAGVSNTVHVVRALGVGGGATSLYVGGDFDAAPSGDAYLARWACPGLPPASFCFGDGSQATACPCGNSGASSHGCNNSASTGGAALAAGGATHPDSVVLTCLGELPSVLSIFLQGATDLAPGAVFGDGVRCVGGSLKRLYVKHASGGVVSAPGIADLSVSARSAVLGDPIAPGTTRSYQVYYRDPNLAFCPTPAGNSWNVSSAVRISW